MLLGYYFWRFSDFGSMINLNIKISDEHVHQINTNPNPGRVNFRKVRSAIGFTNAMIFTHLDQNPQLEGIEDLIKCGFCGSIRIFNFSYICIDNILHIDNIKYDKEISICSRKDNEVTSGCKSKSLNSNSKELVKVAYNLSTLEEANDMILNRNKSPFYATNYDTIEEYSKAQSRTKEFYGSDERYNEVLKKLGNSNRKATMIEKYGIVKAQSICDSKDNSSPNYFKERYGDNWEEEYKLKNSKTVQTLDSFTSRYGELGKEKYETYLENKSRAFTNHLLNSTKDERALNYDTNSKDFFKRKFGDNWEEEYMKHHSNLQTKASCASNESMKFFSKLISNIDHLNLNYYIGHGDRKEYFIYDNDIKKFNLFDFCIKNLKIIIEFHGSLWHYNPEFDYKKTLPFGMILEEHKIRDEYKRNLAESRGFKYFVVFDTDDYNDKALELGELIHEENRLHVSNK